MTERKKDIAFLFIMVSVIGVFLFGMIKWPEYKDSSYVFGKHLYYITIAFVMYIMSFLSLMFAKTLLSKSCASVAVALFGYNIYIELFLDPENWTKWDMWSIIFLAANFIISFIILEKIKAK